MQNSLAKRSRSRRAAPKGPAKGALALRLAFIRQLHIYVSLFVAPSLIFFAGTGALQTFRLPDEKAAPVVVQKLARLHKDDVFSVKPPRPERPKAGPKGDHATPDKAKPQPSAATQALKWFFAAVSVAMIVSTSLGIWMAFSGAARRKWPLWLTFIAGIVAPVLLVLAA